MKNSKYLALALLLGLFTSTAFADVEKGQKLFAKKLKKSCGMSGAAMAGKYSQSEWEDINSIEGGLKSEIQKLCPDVKDKQIKDKFMPHYYDFFNNFANDSGNVPSC